MSQTLLVVDDAVDVREMLKNGLTAQGFHVVTAANGLDALAVARRVQPDLVLLDIVMPLLESNRFFTAFRRESEAPIILLTCQLDKSDELRGFELGVDDYVIKPIVMRDLIGRVRAQLLRAGHEQAESEPLHGADIVLDKDSRIVCVGGEKVNLTPTEFDLLAKLMAARGRVLGREELIDGLAGRAHVEHTVDVHIHNLRAKIEPDPANPRYIETVFSFGYRFRADSKVVQAGIAGSSL